MPRAALLWHHRGVLAPIVLHIEEKHRMAQLGCVVACVWLDAPTYPQMQTFASVARRAAAQNQGSYLFNLVIDGTPSFDPRVREEAQRLTAEGVNRRGACHVILVDGFRGAATRAFLSSLLMLNKPKTPAKVVADVASAVQHACTCLGGGRPEADSRLLTRFVEWSIARGPSWPPPWG